MPASIGAPVHASFRIRSVGMAQHGDKYTIGIMRIDGETAHLLTLGKTEVLPGLAGIVAPVNTVTHGKIGTLYPLAAGDINDVRVRWRDRNIADRTRRFGIEQRNPGPSEVGR